MKTHFDAEWRAWIKHNVDAGNDRDGIFKILLDEGYAYDAIKRQMRYEPSVPPEQIINPLRQATHDNNMEQRASQTRSTAGAPLADDELYLPNARKLDTALADMYFVEDFLNEEECVRLCELITSRCSQSTLSSEEADKQFRTSSTCYLGEMDDAWVREIDTRICRYLGIHPSYSEPLQGQRYEVGQEFKAHTDYFEAHEIAAHGRELGQRTFTFMIYLNDVEEGGETVFTELQESFTPRRGAAVIWNSLSPDGTPNYKTIHHATQVTKGFKIVITKWFRSRSSLQPAPEMYSKESNEFIANYTRVGFRKDKLERPLFEKILDFYRTGADYLREEQVPGDFVFENRTGRAASSLIELPDSLKQELQAALLPQLEAWSGTTLQPTYVYGVRIYHRDAVLKTHRDRLETHIISTILNVDQRVSKPWPLVIEDNYYRRHEVFLEPGEVVWYEGGRLLHGRPEPLDGELFANVFCHFVPQDYRPRLRA